MSQRSFQLLIRAQWERSNFICVGLDPDLERLPNSMRSMPVCDSISAFNRAIIDATKDIVCAYKPNTAFYEAHGEIGWHALKETIEYIHGVAPQVPTILDAKRADIGNTNRGYVHAFFDLLRADAITVHPYLGREALMPFLERADKGIFVLCRTSNEGSSEFQNLPIGDRPLFEVVAQHISEHWNTHKNCGLVVGATYPEELRTVRSIVGSMPILIPGIGAQGGSIREAFDAGNTAGGNIIFSTSRSVLYASAERDFANAAREALLSLRAELILPTV